MNKSILIGRPVKDWEFSFTSGTGTAVAKNTLAVDRKFSKDGQKEADFIPVTVFGKTAEFVANHSVKGKLIAVSGRIQTGSYEAKDGSKRYTTDVVAEEVKILEWNKTAGEAQNEVFGSQGFEELTGEDTPF